jgi:hypothetical protein
MLFVGGLVSYLRYLCLCGYGCVQHILCCVFCFVWLPLCFVYPMLPISLDCPFVIAPSVFSNVHLHQMHYNHKQQCKMKTVITFTVIVKFASHLIWWKTIVLSITPDYYWWEWRVRVELYHEDRITINAYKNKQNTLGIRKTIFH